MKSRHLIEKEYLLKIKELKKHNKLYYDDSNPRISDSKYDELKKDIIKLENNFNFLKSKESPSLSIGSKPSKNFLKSKHRVKMLSLSNAFDLKIGIRAGLQCVWGCGYEGKIKKKHVLQLVETILKTGVKNLCLADTIGSATPQNVESLLEEIIKNFPEIEITLHLHTNSGLELDNFKVVIIKLELESFNKSLYFDE